MGVGASALVPSLSVLKTRASWPQACAIFALLLFIGAGLWLAVTTPFPAPDELEHLSYAVHLQETGRFLPQFEAMLTLAPGDLSRWEPRPNYIGHPSPYYVFIGLFVDRSLPPMRAVLAPRLASFALLAAAVAFALHAGQRSFGRDKLALVVFCAALTLCPNLLWTAKQITNDSLGVLGGALAYWGMLNRRTAFHAVTAGVGLVAALWAKPNAGLEVGLLVLLMVALHRPVSGARLWAFGLGALLGALPYAVLWNDYGAVVPVTAEALRDVPHANGLASYLPLFVSNISYTWGSPVPSWRPMSTAPGATTVVACWLMLACAAVGAVRTGWRHDLCGETAFAAVCAAGLVLPVHLWFAATKLSYSIPAAAFRYYLPLWPAFAHALAWTVTTARPAWQRVAVAAVVAGALASGWL